MGELRAVFDPSLMGGIVRIEAKGYREDTHREANRASDPRDGGIPYEDASIRSYSPASIYLVPYHQWGNRSPCGEMRVWLRSRE
jgi:DUF1680 family protein